MHRPIVPDTGVLALVPDCWGSQWQPRHQVLSRLGRYFPVVWVNPAPGFRDVWRRPSRYRVSDRRPEPGLMIYSPDRSLPRFHRPELLARAARVMRLAGARWRLRQLGCRRIILYVWRPEFAAALDEVSHDHACYHIDDEYTFSTVDQPIPEPEQRLLERADQVFIHSPALLAKKGGVNPRTHFVPNGVDYASHATATPEPEDLRGIPHPRIGYSGWLKNQLDWDLLEQLAERHPAWSFVLVGSVRHPTLQSRIDRLGEAKNVHLLGGKSTAELARYPQHFDVCMMPYRVDDYTNCIYPLKLHEYLAGGRFTVGSPIRALADFRDVVALAGDLEEWTTAIARGLADDDAEARSRRRAVAREHDWQALVHRIALHLAEGLDGESATLVRASEPRLEPAITAEQA